RQARSQAAAPAETKVERRPSPPPAPAEEPEAEEELTRTRSSPLVRKIAAEHGVDISQIEGTGLAGRVTKNDIFSYIENQCAQQKKRPRRTAGAGNAERCARSYRTSGSRRRCRGPCAPASCTGPAATTAGAAGGPPY